MPLTIAAINAAKPRSKPYKLFDEKGLFLSVEPTGGRLWRSNTALKARKRSSLWALFPKPG